MKIIILVKFIIKFDGCSLFYHKVRQLILLQSTIAILLRSATNVQYKVRQVLQSVTIL